MRPILAAGLLAVVTAAATPPHAPAPRQAPPVRRWGSPAPFPEGSERYREATVTQSIFVLDNMDTIRPVPVSSLESKWHQSGGMDGLTGWRSEKWRLVPEPGVHNALGRIGVKNSYGYTQHHVGLVRSYPVGSRFDDLLYGPDGRLFEHRSRRKQTKGWVSELLYENEEARPKGYSGLKVSCMSCHGESGSGKYGAGLVPGGDTVLSDPLDWSLARGYVR
jgi:hypothetical protein